MESGEKRKRQEGFGEFFNGAIVEALCSKK